MSVFTFRLRNLSRFSLLFLLRFSWKTYWTIECCSGSIKTLFWSTLCRFRSLNTFYMILMTTTAVIPPITSTWLTLMMMIDGSVSMRCNSHTACKCEIQMSKGHNTHTCDVSVCVVAGKLSSLMSFGLLQLLQLPKMYLHIFCSSCCATTVLVYAK